MPHIITTAITTTTTITSTTSISKHYHYHHNHHHPCKGYICYMPYGRRETRYYSREALQEGIVSFFLDKRVQGQGWARVISFIRVKSATCM